MTRPSVAANVVAEISENAPGRVRRKVDKDPTVADGWDWSTEDGACVVAAGKETVRFAVADGVVGSVEDVGCSCLLSPRCFHVLACLSVLDVAGVSETVVGGEADGSELEAGGVSNSEFGVPSLEAVSYTHLTLPTILLV